MRRKLRVREPSVLDSNNSGNNTVIHKCSTSTEQNNKFGSRCTRKWHARTETCKGRCQFSGLRSELFITKFTIQICQEHSLSVRHKNSRGENFRQSGRWPFALDSLIKYSDECHLMEKRFLPPRSQFELWQSMTGSGGSRSLKQLIALCSYQETQQDKCMCATASSFCGVWGQLLREWSHPCPTWVCPHQWMQSKSSPRETYLPGESQVHQVDN